MQKFRERERERVVWKEYIYNCRTCVPPLVYETVCMNHIRDNVQELQSFHVVVFLTMTIMKR